MSGIFLVLCVYVVTESLLNYLMLFKDYMEFIVFYTACCDSDTYGFEYSTCSPLKRLVG